MGRNILVLFMILLLAAGGCSRPGPAPLKKFTRTGEFFSSSVRLDVCYADGQEEALRQAVDEIWARLADIHWRLSVYDPQSDLNRINRSYPDPVTVGADTWLLIKDAVYYNQASLGEFDITIYPLLKLWKDGEKKNVLPTSEQIRLAQGAIGPDKFELLPRNQVRLLNPRTKLSINSIADGFAGDEAARILRAHGLANFLTDTTGELYAGGKNCGGQPWRVGVKDPQDPAGARLVDVLALENTSVTTSGNYEHFYLIGDKRYSHIISPKTGFPRNEIVSVTIIAPSTEFSDFWSTALCLLDPVKGLALIDDLGDGYAGMVLVDDGQGRLLKKASRNYSRYLAP
ncbi:MAG: FAD:protein FMN transferase [Candidatus Omnitrophica bacterium]|nr:FAD:protein FMN transferase [Candidatus Omnitrophota bacterium]